MWAYIFRRLIFNIPVFLGILLLVMLALRVNDPVWVRLGKNATQEAYEIEEARLGLDRPFFVQYFEFLGDVVTLNFDQESWGQKGYTVGERLGSAIKPSLAITVPALVLTSLISIGIGLISSFFRGGKVDRTLVILAVLGMSVSFLVYIILGQYFGAYKILSETGTEVFAISGYEPGFQNWFKYCLLPVLISVIVAMGYDTRFYRAVMVEETTRDYIVTARAKGASRRKILFVHMLKNAMIPIITRIMITLPFLIVGSILLEMYFSIPGMGRTLITAINDKDFPVIQVFTAMFAVVFILSNILTDVLYTLVDPRVRLS
ncbi:MAG: ABC transporter permease [Planctomycetota bacterium]